MEGLASTLASRLSGQLAGFLALVGDLEPETLERRPDPGKWSAHENLAHLARHHQVMLARLESILREDQPLLERYRAEDDPQWPAWARVPPGENLSRLKDLRSDLVAVVRTLSAADLARTGLHPAFGEMSVPAWVEFFLLHEAHHLYRVLVLVGGARRK